MRNGGGIIGGTVLEFGLRGTTKSLGRTSSFSTKISTEHLPKKKPEPYRYSYRLSGTPYEDT
jgi:hypothetical protein